MSENAKLPIHMPGLDARLLAEVEERVEEFEREHEQNVIHGGAGYVERIHARDYIIAVVINAVLGIYWLWAILT